MLWSSLTLIAFLAAPVPAGDRPVWDEYGLQSVQPADFGKYRTLTYRFKDVTGAYAGWVWLKSTDPSARLSGSTVSTCKGACPAPPKQTTPLLLPGYLPQKDEIPGSRRYVIGPASLARFAPALPSRAVAFQFSTEAAVARYRTPKGEFLLAIVSYPTPSIARQQAAEFRKSPGIVVKRSGPLVLVSPDPPDAAAVSALLSPVSYRASITWDETPPDPHFAVKLKQMLAAIGELILFLTALCVAGGLGVGGVRAWRARFGKTTADNGVILLHLTDR